ncbi:hypothetical protein SISNIDRAFT_488032 [Sistotremastrum niveocremeum HHB9708]|uniref:CCHC-type domain-containing protein n=1 Tax=Sistotremastrum niveocremeum HHB9708 TaxID=1314777 RepID=A0A164RNQ4_9AGAM|nr:hypothetical protein SISNIDRAFT_488032 [Sistotremastrum niveocremeum HHB9708]
MTTAVAWSRLYNYFSTASSRESGTIFRQISTYECAEDMDVDQWLIDMRKLYSRYKAHGGTNMPDTLFAENLLLLLPESWTHWCGTYEQTTKGKTLNSEIVISDIRTEWGRLSRRRPSALASVFTARAAAERKRKADSSFANSARPINRPRVPPKCTNCGKLGHFVQACWGVGGGAEGQYPQGYKGRRDLPRAGSV